MDGLVGNKPPNVNTVSSAHDPQNFRQPSIISIFAQIFISWHIAIPYFFKHLLNCRQVVSRGDYFVRGIKFFEELYQIYF